MSHGVYYDRQDDIVYYLRNPDDPDSDFVAEHELERQLSPEEAREGRKLRGMLRPSDELLETLHSPPVPGGGSRLSAADQGRKLRAQTQARNHPAAKHIDAEPRN